MPILELTEFKALKGNNKRLLGVDVGQKVLGIAICDPQWKIASPMLNIQHKKFTTSAEAIFKLIDEENVGGIVIGLPLDMEGGENNKMCQSVRQFGRNLTKIRDINICFVDERFSTSMAQQNLDNSDISWDRKQELIDKIAASYILQGFLDSIK